MKSLSDDPVEVAEYRPGRILRSLRTPPDILHLHWPETAVTHPFYPRAVLRAVVVLIDMLLLRLRGTTIVWTRHDSQSHSHTHPRTERVFVRLYQALTEGYIHLTDASVSHFDSDKSARRQAVIHHGIGPIGSVTAEQRRAMRKTVGLEDRPTLGIVGRLESYKNVVEVVDAFDGATGGQLLIAGQPSDDDYAQLLEERAGKAHVHMILRRFPAEEFRQMIAVCDVLLLPYSGHLNSGVAFEAMAAPTKIAITDSPAFLELQATGGADWVRKLELPVDAETLAAMVSWAAEGATSLPALSDTWNQVAVETQQFMASLHQGVPTA